MKVSFYWTMQLDGVGLLHGLYENVFRLSNYALKSEVILILSQFFIFYISIILGAYTKVCRTIEENKNKRILPCSVIFSLRFLSYKCFTDKANK